MSRFVTPEVSEDGQPHIVHPRMRRWWKAIKNYFNLQHSNDGHSLPREARKQLGKDLKFVYVGLLTQLHYSVPGSTLIRLKLQAELGELRKSISVVTGEGEQDIQDTAERDVLLARQD